MNTNENPEPTVEEILEAAYDQGLLIGGEVEIEATGGFVPEEGAETKYVYTIEKAKEVLKELQEDLIENHNFAPETADRKVWQKFREGKEDRYETH